MSAYFKSQRGGVSPHSPKVCLLGGGWVPTESGTMPITIDGREIRVNRYILSKDGNENFLLYWFAPQRKIYANEYAAKMDTLARSFIRHRNDTAFVRVIVPIPSGKAAEAEQVAVSFVQANFDRLNRMFPQ
jgi:EpsI family protein